MTTDPDNLARVIEVLERIIAHGGPYLDRHKGLCWHMQDATRAQLDRKDAVRMSLSAAIYDAVETWGPWSGNLNYPVPSCNAINRDARDTYDDYFDSRADMYGNHAYGQSRLDLAAHLLKHFKELQ